MGDIEPISSRNFISQMNEILKEERENRTNEEHIRSCSFNELARVLYCMIINGERIRPDLEYIKRWLKEKCNE